jgi:hypothetical protein
MGVSDAAMLASISAAFIVLKKCKKKCEKYRDRHRLKIILKIEIPE